MARRTLKWEAIDTNIPVFRTPVKGGWLICGYPHDDSSVGINFKSIGMFTFIPDDTHEWNGTSDTGKAVHNHYLLNKDKCIEFGMVSNAFRHRHHVVNSLEKLLRENPDMTSEQLSRLWYARVLDRTHGYTNTDMKLFNEKSFLTEDR